jgi:hypothetical protein
MESLLLVAALGLVLAVAWIATNRRHLDRRRRRSAEWVQAQERPDLWTSSARCPRCGRRGGVLELDGDAIEFVCLTCGDRHARAERG